MSVTTAPLSRRRAMTAGLAGAAALMNLAPTRARARDAALAARLDETIDRALADRKIVGTLVMVVRSGDVAYRRAAGYADREAGRAMHADALFRLASLSKTMVSAAALALVEQGGLAVTDPVAQWLPAFTPKTRDGQVPILTVHHLLTHTAGLSYGFYEPEDGPYHQAGVSDGLDLSDLSLDEEVRRIAAAGLAEAPGTRWRYSVASDVLGAVIARAAGEPLPDAVRRAGHRAARHDRHRLLGDRPDAPGGAVCRRGAGASPDGRAAAGLVPGARPGTLLAGAGVRPGAVSVGRLRHGR
jgi:CubicO group peptidase (beta-lactamase class C family)